MLAKPERLNDKSKIVSDTETHHDNILYTSDTDTTTSVFDAHHVYVTDSSQIVPDATISHPAQSMPDKLFFHFVFFLMLMLLKSYWSKEF
jgi:hypothetical protein